MFLGLLSSTRDVPGIAGTKEINYKPILYHLTKYLYQFLIYIVIKALHNELHEKFLKTHRR
jgi:hypothetical protein